MCGLIGFSGKESANMHKILHLLADNDSRGGHSVGVYMNGNMFKSTDVKGTGKSGDLRPIFAKENITDFGKLIIGHTRFATQGEHSIKNAHPFQENEIIGAHNGVLSNYEEVGKKFGIEPTDVDSQMIFKVLADSPNKYLRLGMFSGSLNTLFTKSDGKLYVFRHDNPLFALKTKEGTYFSSLEEGLKDIKSKGESIYGIKSNIIYILENGKVIYQKKIKRIEVPSTRIVNTNWRSYNNGYSGYLSNHYGTANDDYNTREISNYNNSYSQQDLFDDEADSYYDEFEELRQEISSHQRFVDEIYQSAFSGPDRLKFTTEEENKLWDLSEFLSKLEDKIIEII